MSEAQQKFSSLGFAKTFVLPGLLVFLVPVLSLLFFLHAQSRFDAQAREEILSQIREDATLTPEDRERAIAHFTEHPFSELIQNDEFAANVDSKARFDYATFRWMIRLSALSIAAGIAVFLLAGLCVLLSLRSQRVQYLSLSAGWQVLRIYGALQTAAQGILLVRAVVLGYRPVVQLLLGKAGPACRRSGRCCRRRGDCRDLQADRHNARSSKGKSSTKPPRCRCGMSSTPFAPKSARRRPTRSLPESTTTSS